MNLKVSLYRYNPEKDKFPYMQNFSIEKPAKDVMVLDLLHLLKENDSSISFRRWWREGVCGSDGMNINGKNGLACITPLSDALKGNKLNLQLGYSHDIDFDIPDGIKIAVEKQTTLKITGSDKQKVGSVASKLKTLRKIEPYKGKGVREKGQHVLKKEGKKK